MKSIKQVDVTAVAQYVEFLNVGKTDFLIQNYSDVNVTINVDEVAVIGEENSAIVLSKTARQLGVRGYKLSVVSAVACAIEVQAVNPAVVIIDNSKIIGDI